MEALGNTIFACLFLYLLGLYIKTRSPKITYIVILMSMSHIIQGLNVSLIVMIFIISSTTNRQLGPRYWSSMLFPCEIPALINILPDFSSKGFFRN
jgi:hypothetical protein